QQQVPRQVGDAESSLSQHPTDQVLFDQDSAWRELRRGIGQSAFSPATFRAEVGVILVFHTAHAEVLRIHNVSVWPKACVDAADPFRIVVSSRVLQSPGPPLGFAVLGVEAASELKMTAIAV